MAKSLPTPEKSLLLSLLPPPLFPRFDTANKYKSVGGEKKSVGAVVVSGVGKTGGSMFRYAFFQYSEVGDFFMPLIICTITDPGQLSLPVLEYGGYMAPVAAGGGEEGERFSGT